MQATTPPSDADSVSYSGKICGSPRFALFHSEPKQKVWKRSALFGEKTKAPATGQGQVLNRTVVKPDRGAE